MATMIPVSKRGTVTLPPELRRRLGLDAMENPLVLVEERDGEIILRPAAAVSVRELSASTIAEWIAEDEEGMREFEASGSRT